MKHFRISAVAAMLIVSGTVQANAAAYSAVYVFGDSLSDNGNLAEVLFRSNLPNPPSFDNAFTNGPTAAAALTSYLGYALRPSLWVTGFRDVFGLYGGAAFVPGTNYAVAGATAQSQAVGGPANINLPQQVGVYRQATGSVADPNALYMIFIGGNDVANATIQGTGATAIGGAVATELAAVQSLRSAGAANFLIVNVPNIGITPRFTQGSPALAPTATTLTQLYNRSLASGLAGLNLGGANVTLFDLYGFNSRLLANAAGRGLTNLTDPCYTNAPLSAATTAACGPGAANIGGFAYWNEFHPTGTVHALWAEGFERALGVRVPAPSAAALMLFGLAGLPLLRARPR
ncbi:MAG: SGNH/GDSL hydrolase family protein [Sphingomonadaceae bacterium]|nr:SGNH/GDSL hydrolase family protein [Sphingomonadaceae bacterium]